MKLSRFQAQAQKHSQNKTYLKLKRLFTKLKQLKGFETNI